jgi:hypothetical protein
VVVFVNVFVDVFDLNKQMLHVEHMLQLLNDQKHINVKFPIDKTTNIKKTKMKIFTLNKCMISGGNK